VYGVNIGCQVPLKHVALLHPILQVIAVPVDVKADIAVHVDVVGAVDGDARASLTCRRLSFRALGFKGLGFNQHTHDT